MECTPDAKVESASAADPLATGAVPRDAAPSRNCTVPVAAAGDTVAVNVTDCPAVDGFTEEVSVTLEAALLTVCATAAEVLVR
jgi:putative methionine-R-sulfoxide reductase with GAF domain